MMRSFRKAAFVTLTVVAAFLAGIWVGQIWSNGAPIAPATTERADTQSPGAAESANEEADRAWLEFRKEVEALRGERDTLSSNYLQIVLKLALDGKGEVSPSGEAASRWNVGFARVAKHRGGFDRMDASIALLIDMSRLGAEGARQAGLIASDRTRTDEERELALEVLRRMPEAEAFEILVDFRDPDLTELDYPYDLISGHVFSLPTGVIARRAPEIVRQIDADLAADSLSPERAEVLLGLALVHNNRQASQMLYDPRMWQENVGGVIAGARDLHTHAAYEFVQAVADWHEDRSSREHAERVLDDW